MWRGVELWYAHTSADATQVHPAIGVYHVKGRNAKEKQPEPRCPLLEPKETPGWRLDRALELLREEDDSSAGVPQMLPLLQPTQLLAPAQGVLACLTLESVNYAASRDAFHMVTIDNDSDGMARLTHWAGSNAALKAPFSGAPSTWREATPADARAWLEALIKRETVTRGTRSEKQAAMRYKVVLYKTSWGSDGEVPVPLSTASNFEALSSWLAEREDEAEYWELEGEQLADATTPMTGEQYAEFTAVCD